MGELTRAEHHAFAMRIAQRDAPRTLMWVGNVVVVFGLVSISVPQRASPMDHVGIVASGVFMVVLGQVLARARLPAAATPWFFCGAVAIVLAYLLRIYVVEQDTSDLTYVLIGVTAYAPLSFAWLPYLTSSGLILVLTHAAMATQQQVDRGDWLVAFVAAIALGGVLLALRLRLLRELADAEAEIARRVTTDPLTDLLSRQGMAARLPEVWGRAHRSGLPVCVWFLDVRGLKQANDEYGHEFGDQVLCDTARALRMAVRSEDVVARWGGDEFVVLGVGVDTDADALHDRVLAAIAADGRARRDRWSGDVTVGLATAAADDASFAELLERADQDMYRHRRDRTGLPPPDSGTP